MSTSEQNDRVGFNVSVGVSKREALADGYNEYGVRENYSDDDDLESIDVIFEAMEPGVRKGVEITSEFLQFVANNSESGVPAMLDHSSSQLAKAGNVTDVKFSDNFLRVKVNVPNTGSSVKEDIIADFTHDPPDIQDGSVGFDTDSIEFTEPESEDAHAKFQEAKLQEFSFTPFPGGYDEGGLTPKFSEMVDEFAVGEKEWEEGSLVEYQANPEMMGLVVTVDEERQVAMVTLHTEEDGTLVDSGYTVTAGYDDLIAYQGDATPESSDSSEDSEYSDSQLETTESQLISNTSQLTEK